MSSGFEKTAYWRDAVFKRNATAGWPEPACCWCCVPLTYNSATLEHLLPRVHGGIYELSNLDIACKPCNNARGNNYYPPVPKYLRSE